MALSGKPLTAAAGRYAFFARANRAGDRLITLIGWFRKPTGLILCDALLVVVSAYATLCIDMATTRLPASTATQLLHFLPILIMVRIASLAAFGGYRTIVRHTGIRDVLSLAGAATTSSLSLALYAWLRHNTIYGASTIMIGWYTHLFLVVGSRVAYRLLWRAHETWAQSTAGSRRHRMIILGAGARGASLAAELKARASGQVTIVGFLDDDVRKRGLRIDGVPVIGSIDDLKRVVETRRIDLVVIAMGAATGKYLRTALQLCDGMSVRFQVAPNMNLLRHDKPFEPLRDISLEDLLHRPSHSIDMAAVGSYLAGERVLITGAGGSIGSELVRQIASRRPAELILVGHGENSLFEIQQELLRSSGISATCVVADVRDQDRLFRLFGRHRPTVVFHAAAHKHVGLMECNPEEAVTNNVLGTRNLVRVASRTGVARFVMISTDKAVNPTSVMGMTKRVAERIVQDESRKSATQFACVRFGNVLGSRGSVVPLMRKQIEAGGPVTVTHPDIVRYFMTIPEAAQLVITAGAMGENSAIYLLEMGEPVRILDLAEDLIRLAGLTPGRDISIEITGLKKGEKLYEELLTDEEGATVTHHERIFVAPASEIPSDLLNRYVDTLVASAAAGDTEAVVRLLRRVDLLQEELSCVGPITASLRLAA